MGEGDVVGLDPGSPVGEGDVVGLDPGSLVGEGDVVGLDPGSTMGVGDVGADPVLSVWVATVAWVDAGSSLLVGTWMDVVDTNLLLGGAAGVGFDVCLSVGVVTTTKLELDASACMRKRRQIKELFAELTHSLYSGWSCLY